MKIYSKVRSQWIKFPTKGMNPMVEPHKHNLTLKAENEADQLLIEKLILVLEEYNSRKISAVLNHIEEIQAYE